MSHLVWIYTHVLTFYLHQGSYLALEDQLFAGTKKVSSTFQVLYLFLIACLYHIVQLVLLQLP